MTRPTRKALAADVTDTLHRLINRISLGARIPRDYGEGRKMTILEAQMCALILRHEGISGSQISRELGVTRSSTSQYITKLEKKGYLYYESDENNAKVKRIFLTEDGMKSARVAMKYARMMEDNLFNCSADELIHYSDFVHRLEDIHSRIMKLLTSGSRKAS